MSQLRDVKKRIESVKKTRKMTRAMQMVSAAKFKRASRKAVAMRPFLSEMMHMLQRTLQAVDGDVFHPLTLENNTEEELVILVTGDRGLCGGFNSNIIKKCHQYLSEQTHETTLMIFGRKGYQYFKRREWTIVDHYEGYTDAVNFNDIYDKLKHVAGQYIDGEYGKVTLFYNEFQSVITSKLIKTQLFPVIKADAKETNIEYDYFIEPNAFGVTDNLILDYVSYLLQSVFYESFAAEQGARMAAMDTATDNAGDMIRQLSLIYNRQRQALITAELSEIVAGAESLTQ